MSTSTFSEALATNPYLVCAVALVCLGGLVDWFLGIKKNGSEPPFLPTKIPYIGHLLGIIKYRIHYYSQLTQKYGHKVYSLAMPGGRVYIVNSPDVISTIQKLPRVLSFWFIEASLTKNLGGISDKANKILLENARGEKGNNSLVVDGMKATHKAMAGDYLDSMTRVSLQRASKEINALQTEGTSLELWEWVQHVFSLTVSAGVYGPGNPYEDSVLERGLATFADNTMTFLSGLPAWLVIPKAYRARERIVAAFEKYFAADCHTDGSELVKARFRVLQEYGIPASDIARFESVNGFGILLNLLPTAYWTIYHVFSDTSLLQAVRQEALAALQPSEDFTSILDGSLDQSKLNDMPILASVMKECLRYHTSGAAARMVMQDYMLSDKYYLKKDSYVFIPNRAVHFDTDTWGANADSFDAYRFDKRNSDKIHPAAFRGFGGGVNLCPGRAFATRIILAVVAAMALRYDMKPLSATGNWEDPEHDESSMAIVLARPQLSTRVSIVPRAHSVV